MPSVFPAIFTKRYQDKLLVIIDVSEGINKPYHFAAQRISNSTYVRLGAHTMLATPDIIYELQWLKQCKFLDEIPVQGADDDVNLVSFKKILSERKQLNNKGDTVEMLYHYDILKKNKGHVYPTVGGILLFGKRPEKFFPEAFIICTHFSGTLGRDAIATKDCVGNLFQQYKDTIAFILSRLNRSFKIEGTGTRDEQLELPPEAIREAVLNAIIHRNYQIAGAIKISIYDDRLEIFSPGNFPGPILADNVDIGVTYIRNSIISRVFRDMGYVEKLGSGFITIFESYAKWHLPKPVIIEGAGFVKCILPRVSAHVPKIHKDDTEELMKIFLIKDEITAQDVMQMLSVSRATASRMLTKFTELGLVERLGKGVATRYRKPPE